MELLDKTYFQKDRRRKIDDLVTDSIALLDQKPVDLVQNKKEKAQLLFFRGKVLDFNPSYSKAAEEQLSKSIKLLPSNTDAWNALGHVYWKKREFADSKRCYEGCL